MGAAEVVDGIDGELRPAAGDALVGGSINIESPLYMQVERTGMDTVLAEIGRLLEQAQGEKPAVKAHRRDHHDGAQDHEEDQVSAGDEADVAEEVAHELGVVAGGDLDEQDAHRHADRPQRADDGVEALFDPVFERGEDRSGDQGGGEAAGGRDGGARGAQGPARGSRLPSRT